MPMTDEDIQNFDPEVQRKTRELIQTLVTNDPETPATIDADGNYHMEATKVSSRENMIAMVNLYASRFGYPLTILDMHATHKTGHGS